MTPVKTPLPNKVTLTDSGVRAAVLTAADLELLFSPGDTVRRVKSGVDHRLAGSELRRSVRSHSSHAMRQFLPSVLRRKHNALALRKPVIRWEEALRLGYEGVFSSPADPHILGQIMSPRLRLIWKTCHFKSHSDLRGLRGGSNESTCLAHRRAIRAQTP